MNTHKNARLTVQSRIILIRRITEDGLRPREAAQAQGVSPRTAYKWLDNPDHWTPVRAQVVENKPRLVDRGDNGIKFYGPGVTYRYRVQGREYEGDRYAGSASEDKGGGEYEDAVALIDGLVENGQITVYYRKDKPEMSRVKVHGATTSRSQSLALMVGSLLVWDFGLLLLVATTGYL